MMDTVGRARLIGGVVLVAVFAAGIAVGQFVIPRRVPEGIAISLKASSRIPRELEALGLSETQRGDVARILNNGTKRVGRVLEGMMPPMNAVIDSTDREIRAILTEAQVRQLDAIRKEQPLRRMRTKRMIDSSR